MRLSLHGRGFKNLTELNGILSAQLLIRRLKKNVLGDLPPLTRSRKTVLPDDRCMLVSSEQLLYLCLHAGMAVMIIE